MIKLFDRFLEIALIDDDGMGLDFSQLKVLFHVERTVGSGMNLAEVAIYNLTNETARKIETNGYRLVIRAGYQQRYGSIFQGQVRTPSTFQEGPDRITKFYAYDGDYDYRNAQVNISFPVGSSLVQIVKTVVDSFSFLRAGSFSSIEDRTLSGSQQFSKRTRDVLDELADGYGFEWSIQNEVIEIVRKGASNGSTPVDISRNNGMIGSPIVRTDTLVEVKTLLDPAIIPNGTIRIDTAGAEVQGSAAVLAAADRLAIPDVNAGEFQVLSVNHVGDTRGQAWYSTTVGIRSINGNP